MASSYDDFWAKAGPGLLNLGAGAYTANLANDEMKKRLQAAQGPLYNQAMGAASGLLTSAGSFNPDAFAKDRFNAEQALVQPVNDRQFAQLQTALRAKGQLGLGMVNPGVEGYTPQPGVYVNPQMAAFFAAQQGARNRSAYDSMAVGQNQLDSILKRAGMLSGQAANVQNAGLLAQRTQPSRAAQISDFLKGGLGVLKDSGVTSDIFKKIPGMIGGGIDWLQNTFSPPTLLGSADFNDFSWI